MNGMFPWHFDRNRIGTSEIPFDIEQRPLTLIKSACSFLRALFRYVKLLSLVKRYQRKNVTIADVFHQNVAKHPQKTCLIYENQEWSFRDVNEFANRIANLFQQNGFKRGDVVALFMENRPEFVCTWLGLSKIGVIVPLINTNLRQASLLHSITIAKCQALIYSESLVTGKLMSCRLSKLATDLNRFHLQLLMT